jgi:protein-disulfide isomerase
MLNKLIVPISIVIAGLLVAGAVYFSNKTPTDTQGTTPTANNAKPGNPNDPVAINAKLAPVTDKDHIMGSADAKLVIVEYSDFQCPYCQKFQTTMEQVMEEYGKDGQVAWVYRHYPLDFHADAMPAAVASECVARIGGSTSFWAYSKTLFEDQSDLSAENLRANAIGAGVDGQAYDECLASGYGEAEVEADMKDAAVVAQSAPGGFGTPYSVVVAKDGTQFVIEGAQPYFRVKQILDTLLSK